jgi:hypothetical protein
MSTWDFVTSLIRYSYSSTAAFENCPYSFKLAYLDLVPRENNFFGEFGTLVHSCFEHYFNGKIDAFELSQYYRDNYAATIKTPLLNFTPGLDEKYMRQGLDFFDNFSFNKDAYDILAIEDKIDFDLNGSTAVAKPDLLLRDKSSGKVILYDYKTATPFWTKANGKEMSDKNKIESYYNQMYIYTYALQKKLSIPIDEILLWYVRLNKQVSVPWVLEEEEKAIARFDGIIKKIKEEEVFPYNNSNLFFCDNLCGVRNFCEYR